jgi:hypothetical protein
MRFILYVPISTSSVIQLIPQHGLSVQRDSNHSCFPFDANADNNHDSGERSVVRDMCSALVKKGCRDPGRRGLKYIFFINARGIRFNCSEMMIYSLEMEQTNEDR